MSKNVSKCCGSSYEKSFISDCCTSEMEISVVNVVIGRKKQKKNTNTRQEWKKMP